MNAHTASTRRSRWLTIGLLLAILLLALGLRFIYLGGQSLWNDEGTSLALAQRDLPTIARDAALDIHPPLYYWLLHGWVRLAGTNEAGARSLSALLGVALVGVTYALGRLLGGRAAGLAAAFLAAISPFQVYYAQEARMYILLALLATLAFYAALRWTAEDQAKRRRPWAAAYVVTAAAGLYTHYAFAMVLAAANLAVGLDLALRWRTAGGPGRLARWLALQLGALLLFAPWLPTAYRQLSGWPRGSGLLDTQLALAETWRVLIFGPAGQPSGGEGWQWAVLLFLFLLAPLPRRSEPGPGRRLPDPVVSLAPVLWLALPVALMLALGLFKGAYLKFLLVASPPLCLVLGRVLTSPPRLELPARWQRALYHGMLGWVLLMLALISAEALQRYYVDPAYARDDYRALAGYIQAAGRPGDAVILNAPGQQEVFDYYYRGGLAVHPLPASRPPDPAATEAALVDVAQPGGRIFAVLWATDESDPNRIVEGWLDNHSFKAMDAWYGNVRLAVYGVPTTESGPTLTPGVPLHSASTSDQIRLVGYSPEERELRAGDIAQIALYWQAERALERRYKVFAHVLDANNNIVGQWDTEPGAGTRPTTQWQPGERIAERLGVAIHPGTPPGEYRVEVGLYDLETGARLLTPDGANVIWLEPLTVARPDTPTPAAALRMLHQAGVELGDLMLLGYDVYPLGQAPPPEAPLRPGDVLHVNLYWRALSPPGGDWRLAVRLLGADGEEELGLDAEPVPGYGTSRWQAGDVWRGQINLPLPADLAPGRYRLQVQALPPAGKAPAPFLSAPFAVEGD